MAKTMTSEFQTGSLKVGRTISEGMTIVILGHDFDQPW